MAKLRLFTDGSCQNNGKKGARAGIGIYFPRKQLPNVSKPFTIGAITNQRAELYAILVAIKMVEKANLLSEYKSLVIYTDSNYSIKCVTTWIKTWIKNGWMNSKKEPVSNLDLIKKIYKKMQGKQITFKHVKAHTDSVDFCSYGNRKADKLATKGAEKSI